MLAKLDFLHSKVVQLKTMWTCSTLDIFLPRQEVVRWIAFNSDNVEHIQNRRDVCFRFTFKMECMGETAIEVSVQLDNVSHRFISGWVSEALNNGFQAAPTFPFK